MSKHAPGPWAVKYHDDTDTRTVYVAGRAWESWTVCVIGHSTHDEQNARLIAAAPDLIASLRRVLQMLEIHDPYLANFGEVEEARSIISRAEGAPYWGE